MADLLIASTGAPGRSVATLARASARWSRIAFLTVDRSPGANDVSDEHSADLGTGTYDLMASAAGSYHVSTGPTLVRSNGADSEPRAERCGDWPIVGNTQAARELLGEFSDLFVAEQSNEKRAKILRRMAKLGFFLPCLVHPSAVVCRSATMDYGCLVAPQATVETEVQLGMGNIIGPGATVGYECAFGLAVHVSAGAHLGAGARIGGYTHIGIGAIVSEGVTIGQSVTVRAGAVVTDDIPDGVTVAGSPAAILPNGYAHRLAEARIGR